MVAGSLLSRGIVPTEEEHPPSLPPEPALPPLDVAVVHPCTPVPVVKRGRAGVATPAVPRFKPAAPLGGLSVAGEGP